MFSRSFAAIVLALPALTGAVGFLQHNNVGNNRGGLATGNQGPTTQCNTGSLQCCNQVQSADSTDPATLALFGGIVGAPGTLVGLSCSPINVAAIGGGSSCSAQPVCCTNNEFHGIVAGGCEPVNVNI